VSNRIAELNAKIEDANRRETNAARLLIQNPDNENYQTAANEVAAELKALRNQLAVEKANNPNLPPDFFEVLLATHRAKREAAKEELPAINAQLGMSLGTILEPVHLTANGIMRVLFKPSLGQDIEYEMVEPPHARPPGWFQRAGQLAKTVRSAYNPTVY
jgi:hypothetical protein